ncbi:hypothetical protein MLD38_039843 [Melastoma candidum]|uniref:Uncharacterized protein n=1 Tax=Melastoma candidum TaxID=119954 RepID=A0ACB9L4K9_9MYRT|nr:hypothetical protein MLD38_039843 [Melastoma candidum]
MELILVNAPKEFSSHDYIHKCHNSENISPGRVEYHDLGVEHIVPQIWLDCYHLERVFVFLEKALTLTAILEAKDEINNETLVDLEEVDSMLYDFGALGKISVFIVLICLTLVSNSTEHTHSNRKYGLFCQENAFMSFS